MRRRMMLGWVLASGLLTASLAAKESKAGVSVEAMNHALGLTLWADEDLWDDASKDVAARLKWPQECQTSYLSIYRNYPREATRILGTRCYMMAFYGKAGKANGLFFIFANKGYCVPATWERYLRYMGVDADMYVLAMAGGTEAGGGTSIQQMIAGASQFAALNGLQIQKSRVRIAPKTISRYIDQGRPLMWLMRIIPGVNDKVTAG